MIKTFNSQAASSDILSTLFRDGGVIVENQVEHDLVDKISSELRPHFADQGDRFQNDFNGYKTLRLGAILTLSRSAAELIAHPRVMAMADGILKPHCENYRIGS